MRLTARLLALAPQVRLRLAGQVALLLGVTATYVGQGILIARVLARIFAGQPVASVIGLLAGVVALVAVRGVLFAQRDVAAVKASAAVKKALRQRLVGKLFELGPGWLQRTRTGTVQSTIVDGVEAVDAYVGRFLPQCVVTVVGAAGVTAYVIVLDPLVGAIVLVCAVISPLVPKLSQRLIRARTQAWWVTYKGLYAENLDALQGMATLKAFNASRRRGAELERQAEEFCRVSIGVMAIWGAYLGVVGLVTAVGTAVAVGIGAIHRATGALSTTELLTILLLARECFRPLKDLEHAYHESWSFRSSSEGILELLDAQPDVAEPAAPASIRVSRPSALGGTSPLPPASGGTSPRPPASGGTSPLPPGLTFEEVSFAYRERSRPALDRFSLEVAPGERVALVGRSGAGKTTVVSLLLRFFELGSGRILIDNYDIGELPLEDLRALVAVVAQDTYLFHGTVRHNLRLARPDAAQGQLETAARAAQAHEFIAALPQGYDTIVGERGLKLSGGQRQRIAIARALLKDAPILVLDEATSSVDAANEAGIHQALDTLSRGRTTLVIAHRLSTVRDADRVVVLDAGQVVETGDHTRLLARQGAYAQLVAAQQGVGGSPPSGRGSEGSPPVNQGTGGSPPVNQGSGGSPSSGRGVAR
ncbi:MAG: ABC transporter ATP-binding protein [Egibacteraceae bacterium]